LSEGIQTFTDYGRDKSSVPVSLSIGANTGTTSVNALIFADTGTVPVKAVTGD
jgi:hypothetical protein